jgi:hypothetical protein
MIKLLLRLETREFTTEDRDLKKMKENDLNDEDKFSRRQSSAVEQRLIVRKGSYPNAPLI